MRARPPRPVLLARGGLLFGARPLVRARPGLVGALLFVVQLAEHFADGLVLGPRGVEDRAAGLRGADAEFGVVAVGAPFGRGAPLARRLEVEAVD